MNRKRAATAFLVTLSALGMGLSGCSSSVWGAPEAEVLGEGKYALCFSKQSSAMDGKHQDGKLVIANQDGSFSEIQTWGMDTCSMAWNEAGLFFSDTRNDYRLDNAGLTTISSEKTDSQYGMLATSSDTAVGIYNLGFSETGYITQVVTTSGTTSTKKEIEGGYFIVSKCDGAVYGMGIGTGPYSTTGDPETEPMVLNQLTGTADGKEKNVGSSSEAREGISLEDAPCIGGKIYYISDAKRGGLDASAQPVLSSWDVDTGKYESHPLVTEDKNLTLFRQDGTGFPYVASGSVNNGALEWLGAGNSIMSTELKNGNTKQRFTVEGYRNDSAMSKAVFTENEVIVLADNNDGSNFRIVRYDRITGKELGRTVLDVRPDKLSDGMFFRGFAAKP
ncbi:hypothetical protein [Glutamicibacter halophytocola]|uniref:Uncharacterized protein n=1 Tax=Glutamicibacter halophytocola TaxID=1933880 RepID=A0AA95BQV1_9MICC|nr:hypothetical protein [Glutamicibacter halophytocola]UUX59635.1 hypothetical protein NUH22_03110 [Glutamicibacter halophytocola]